MSWRDELTEPLAAPEVATTMSVAFAEAEARAAEREAAERARTEALAEELVYAVPTRADETPFPPEMYVGTGIGHLYGLPSSEAFADALDGWNVELRSTR
jgi:hypothetical protein